MLLRQNKINCVLYLVISVLWFILFPIRELRVFFLAGPYHLFSRLNFGYGQFFCQERINPLSFIDYLYLIIALTPFIALVNCLLVSNISKKLYFSNLAGLLAGFSLGIAIRLFIIWLNLEYFSHTLDCYTWQTRAIELWAVCGMATMFLLQGIYESWKKRKLSVI